MDDERGDTFYRLRGLFPAALSSEITRCLQLSQGELDKAAELMLANQDRRRSPVKGTDCSNSLSKVAMYELSYIISCLHSIRFHDD